MSTLDLRNSDIREKHGLMNETVTAQSHHRRTVQTHRDRAETRALIVHALYEVGQPMTRLQLARHIARAKTPHLVGLIEELVGEGIVARTQAIGANGVVVYWYEVAL